MGIYSKMTYRDVIGKILVNTKLAEQLKFSGVKYCAKSY